ncbi:tripartite tricarboxylate transporter substrate-binding protein [Agrococcus sp. ARC_14]|uniref:Bug family tripartite tricarboxylate transporter substrate binding protein n=1 Tax=Agrococcus sp. ARC_14 TaxID=2919927 RepID=UPI001F065333|nr:tripartite tricarboxylate transporter substrate-binding protein [Agrococcus sp. ARC_14]MCH1884262.1 tripartite tricarboxylate transporter substrate binding protein [Agrococcus sp. ARC_14]
MHPNTARNTRTQSMFRIGLAGAAALALAACSSGGTPADGEAPGAISAVNVIAPADPGGGWDQTAREISRVLTEDGIVGSAPASNIGGAGGTVGLANLATETDPNTLMVTGSVMVGAVETNASDTRIEDMTPIAQLTEEPLVIVVPADSPYESLQDLVDAIVAEGQGVAVTGGSAGGIDHILAGLLLTEAGVAPEEVPGTLNYVANSGGGEALTMLLGNTVQAGISGVGEFSESVLSGDLRALAVSSAEPAEMLPDVPTIQDEGIDVTITNWRGVIAPGGISDEERAALIDLVTQLHDSTVWADALEQRGWTDAFLAGDDFDAFLTEDITLTQETLRTIGLIE